jgi:mRNA interferase RelE/StbE
MAWSLQFTPDAARDIKKLDRSVAARILKTLESPVAQAANPRKLGRPLKGEDSGYWRWRIGDYRVVGIVRDETVTILVVRVAHRSAVYR